MKTTDPVSPPGTTGKKRSPWPLAIAIGLILVALINVLFIWIAVRGQEPVAQSYQSSDR